MSPIFMSKETHPLPPINKNILINPADVVDKYPYFLKRSKLSRLTVRLAKESFFGEDIMERCTVAGAGPHHALPPTVLTDLKNFMRDLACPHYVNTRASFEIFWKNCLISLGQACKALRDSGPKML